MGRSTWSCHCRRHRCPDELRVRHRAAADRGHRPPGPGRRFRHDAAGRLVEETDFNGRVRRYAYDAAGELIRSTNGLGDTTEYDHDLLGNVVERRTPSGSTRYRYDAVGRLVAAENADAKVVTNGTNRAAWWRTPRTAVPSPSATTTAAERGIAGRPPGRRASGRTTRSATWSRWSPQGTRSVSGTIGRVGSWAAASTAGWCSSRRSALTGS